MNAVADRGDRRIAKFIEPLRVKPVMAGLEEDQKASKAKQPGSHDAG